MIPECQPHAHPVDGGWAGYRAACHDCELTGKVVASKDEARREAVVWATTCPYAKPCGLAVGLLGLEGDAARQQRHGELIETDALDLGTSDESGVQ